MLTTKAAAAAELKWRKAKKSCINFIRKYVYIEDRDAPELAVPFALWPKQAKVIEAFLVNRLTILLKSRQLGATWGSLAYAAWRLVFTPGYSVVALSKREDDAKELTRRMAFILRYLPRWMIREKKTAGKNFSGPVWEATSLSIVITHTDGEQSTFTAMSSAPDSGRSFTSSLVILDEWAFQSYAEEIWAAAYPTVNRPTGGQVIGLSTNKRGSFFESLWKGAVKGENGFTPIFLPWWTDPRRTKEWYEASKKALPHSYLQEYPATPEEALSAGEGTA
ncbi:MAG TPA: terminase family protein, partial [Bacillota bacterium]|nr:terminase family protein [Bacillota bacterium]